jgi:hypothetical protein
MNFSAILLYASLSWHLYTSLMIFLTVGLNLLHENDVC